jgi:hypothetical protein
MIEHAHVTFNCLKEDREKENNTYLLSFVASTTNFFGPKVLRFTQLHYPYLQSHITAIAQISLTYFFILFLE